MTKPIRVVVADDSPFVCRLLTNYLHSSPDFQVVATALNGLRAVQLVKELRPDVVTLDIEMPQMNGLEALEIIMAEMPTPIIMVSGVSREAAATTLTALNMGAVDFILKYNPDEPIDPEALRQEIIDKTRSASRIKVIRSLKRAGQVVQKVPAVSREIHGSTSLAGAMTAAPQPTAAVKPPPYLPGGVIVVGASTGGPVALRELLTHLPVGFGAAIVVVQHIPASFTGVLAAQLNRRVMLRVKEATHGDYLEPGLILVAPGDHHLLIRPDGRVAINQGPLINGHRPSIDVTMQSAAQIYGSRTTGVILTGMGSDGAQGMVAIHAKGGRTYAQSGETCVVNGMPQRTIEKGVVKRIASPAEIGRLLTSDNIILHISRMNYEKAS